MSIAVLCSLEKWFEKRVGTGGRRYIKKEWICDYTFSYYTTTISLLLKLTLRYFRAIAKLDEMHSPTPRTDEDSDALFYVLPLNKMPSQNMPSVLLPSYPTSNNAYPVRTPQQAPYQSPCLSQLLPQPAITAISAKSQLIPPLDECTLFSANICPTGGGIVEGLRPSHSMLYDAPQCTHTMAPPSSLFLYDVTWCTSLLLQLYNSA